MAAKSRAVATSRQAGGRLEGVGRSAAEVVRRATEVLEGELAAGIDAVRKSGKRLREERQVAAADLDEAVARFRADGHDVVELVKDLAAELRSDSTDALVQRLLADAHAALDTVLDLVALTPDLVGQLTRLAGRMAPAQGQTASDRARGKTRGRSRGKLRGARRRAPRPSARRRPQPAAPR